MAGTWQMGEEPAKILSAPAVIRVAGLLADTDEFDAQPDRR
jgi:hypothetical protein